jgi:hypothetical protein
MLDILWKLLFKKAGCTPESIAEVERMLVAEVNRFDKYC